MNLEAKLISSVLDDKQIHILMQSDVDSLLRTHLDIWKTIKEHYQIYDRVPSLDTIQEKHPDFVYTKSSEGTKYVLQEVKDKFLFDGVRKIVYGASKLLQDGEAHKALDGIVENSGKLKRLATNVHDVDAGDADSAISYYEQVIKLREQGGLGIKTGLAGFDACLPSGIMPGHFGILLAYPGIGKSWLMAYFAVQAWRNGKTPMIVSLEMTEAEVRNRIFTIIGNGKWSHRKLSSGDIDLVAFKQWHKDTFSGKPPIHIISSEGSGEINPSVVQGKIDQYKPDIAFLDYLNLMSSNEKSDNETVKMKQLSRQLKILAVSENIPIVAISSATPDDVSDMNSAPTLGQVAWSRQISYDADWLIALGREVNSDVCQIIFRKNRHGVLGEFYLTVDFDAGVFLYRGIDP